jgi:plasmid stabilization system protein ParE
LTEIADACDRLAGNPYLSRTCDEIQPGLRRIEHGEQVIFYQPHVEGIIVSRVLHRSMMAARRAMDEEI